MTFTQRAQPASERPAMRYSDNIASYNAVWREKCGDHSFIFVRFRQINLDAGNSYDFQHQEKILAGSGIHRRNMRNTSSRPRIHSKAKRQKADDFCHWMVFKAIAIIVPTFHLQGSPICCFG